MIPSRQEAREAAKVVKRSGICIHEGKLGFDSLEVLFSLARAYEKGEIGEVMSENEIERILIKHPFRIGKKVECKICGRRKAPWGRSISIATCNSYCTRETCEGYVQEPKADGLFPNEISNVDAVKALTNLGKVEEKDMKCSDQM